MLSGTEEEQIETKDEIGRAMDAAGLNENVLPRVFLTGVDVKTVQ